MGLEDRDALQVLRDAFDRELVHRFYTHWFALDVSVRAQILNLLTDLKASLGLGLVFISHDIQTVRYVSDRIVVMYYGQIVEEGPSAQVFESPSHEYTRTLLGAAPSLL